MTVTQFRYEDVQRWRRKAEQFDKIVHFLADQTMFITHASDEDGLRVRLLRSVMTSEVSVELVK